jgi:hypothetical protein
MVVTVGACEEGGLMPSFSRYWEWAVAIAGDGDRP